MTAHDLIALISQLPKGIDFPYVDDTNKTVAVVSIEDPNGPITIRRSGQSKTVTMSGNMLRRIAAAVAENRPFNVDRVLGASYNTRSALEALLAHTPPFYFCYPGRIERIEGKEFTKPGHKHLLFCPQTPHASGQLHKKEIDFVTSEVPGYEIVYDSIIFTTKTGKRIPNIDPTIRRHTQIQISLFVIGQQLGYRTWIAQNDRNIEYQNKKLVEHTGAIQNLQDEKLLDDYNDAQRAALLIDCIWFKNSHLLPAVMEIEHSTGITSGLDRMQTLYEFIKPFQTRWVIVAPDEDRNRVFKHCQKPQFKKMRPRYFSYSAVEELHGLCLSRKLKGITDEFLDCFMEETVKY